MKSDAHYGVRHWATQERSWAVIIRRSTLSRAGRPGRTQKTSLRFCDIAAAAAKTIGGGRRLLPSSLLDRRATLQIVKPVQHHVQPGRCSGTLGPGFLDHHEALAVGRDVVVRHAAVGAAGIQAEWIIEQAGRRADLELRRSRVDANDLERAAVPVEQLLARWRPHRLLTASD